MTVEELKKLIGQDIIVGDRWGFGMRFYTLRLTGIKYEIFKEREQISLYGSFPKEKHRPFIENYFWLSKGSRTVYKPS